MPIFTHKSSFANLKAAFKRKSVQNGVSSEDVSAPSDAHDSKDAINNIATEESRPSQKSGTDRRSQSSLSQIITYHSAKDSAKNEISPAFAADHGEHSSDTSRYTNSSSFPMSETPVLSSPKPVVRKARPTSWISTAESGSNFSTSHNNFKDLINATAGITSGGRKSRPTSYMSMASLSNSGRRSRPTSMIGPISIDLTTTQTVISAPKPTKPAKEWTYESASSSAFKSEQRADLSGNQERQRKHFERAAELYRRALLHCPGDLDAMCNRARVIFALGSRIFNPEKATDALRESVRLYSEALSRIGASDRSSRVLEARYNFAQSLTELSARICPAPFKFASSHVKLLDMSLDTLVDQVQSDLLRKSIKQLGLVADAQEINHKRASMRSNAVGSRACTAVLVETLLSLSEAALSLAQHVPLSMAEEAFVTASTSLMRAKAANVRLPDSLSVFRGFDLRLAWASASLSRVLRIFSLEVPLDIAGVLATLMEIKSIVEQEQDLAIQPGATYAGGQDRVLLAMWQLSESELAVAHLLRRDELKKTTAALSSSTSRNKSSDMIRRASDSGDSPKSKNSQGASSSVERHLSTLSLNSNNNVSNRNNSLPGLNLHRQANPSISPADLPPSPDTPGSSNLSALHSNSAIIDLPTPSPSVKGDSNDNTPTSAYFDISSDPAKILRRKSSFAIDDALAGTLGPRKSSMIFHLASASEVDQAVETPSPNLDHIPTSKFQPPSIKSAIRRSSALSTSSSQSTEEINVMNPWSWGRRKSTNLPLKISTVDLQLCDSRIKEHLISCNKVLKDSLDLLSQSKLPSIDLLATRTRILLNIHRCSLFQAQAASPGPVRRDHLASAEIHAAWAARVVGLEWILDGREGPSAEETIAQAGGWRTENSGKEAIFRLIRTWWMSGELDSFSRKGARDSIEKIMSRLRDSAGSRSDDIKRFVNTLERIEGELVGDEPAFWICMMTLLGEREVEEAVDSPKVKELVTVPI